MKTSISFVYFSFAMVFLFISCNKEVSTTEPSPDVEIGKIIIESNPPGAKIFLDGDNTAKITPDTFLYMNSADYEIILKKDFFYDTTIFVHLEHDEEKYILVDYYADPSNFATIECTSQPAGAAIFLNDSSTGLYTPNALEFIYPGRHKVKLTYPEHRADSTSIILNMRDKKSVSMILQDTTIWVDYTNSNSGFPTYRDITSILIDENNVKWIGTKGLGLVTYNDKDWEKYGYTSVVSSSWVEVIEMDNTGKIWIGTSKGLRTYQNGIWTSIQMLDGLDLGINFIERISIDRDNNVWIGGVSNELSHYLMAKYNGDKWEIIANEWFYSFAVDCNGIVWAYFHDEVRQFDGESWQPIITGIDEIDNFEICFLKTDPNNNLWIAAHNYNTSQGGLFIYDGQNFTKIEVPYTGITDICFTPEGNTWISTRNGLIKLDNNFIVTYYTTGNSGILANDLTDVAVQSNGNVWLATKENGVIKFKGGNL